MNETEHRPLKFEDDDQTRLEISMTPDGSTPFSFAVVPNGRLRDAASLSIDVYGLALLREWIDEALERADPA